tara:strand:+ start:342 stop:770 length:429 start_codon:yes stop_codon:yes gene_type:complete
MANQLVAEPPTYTPQFNENSGKFEDKSPFVKGERKCIQYKCSCKSGTLFSGYSQWKNHIKSKTHQEYIVNYEKNNKEVDDLKIEKNDLLAKNGVLENKILNLENKNKTLTDQNEKLSEIKTIVWRRIIQKNHLLNLLNDCDK